MSRFWSMRAMLCRFRAGIRIELARVILFFLFFFLFFRDHRKNGFTRGVLGAHWRPGWDGICAFFALANMARRSLHFPQRKCVLILYSTLLFHSHRALPTRSNPSRAGTTCGYPTSSVIHIDNRRARSSPRGCGVGMGSGLACQGMGERALRGYIGSVREAYSAGLEHGGFL